MIPTKVKTMVFDWLMTGPKTATEKLEYRKKAHIGIQAFRSLELEYNIMIRRNAEARQNFADNFEFAEDDDSDLKERRELGQVMRALKSMAIDGRNAFAARVWLQVKGKLTEKQEVTHKLDGSFYAKAALAAEEELAEFRRKQSEGMAEVPQGPEILCPDLLLPAGQGEKTDG